MKKTDSPNAGDVAEYKEQLHALTDEFCDAHLSAEYKRLCRKLIGKIAREKPSPLLRGALPLWAAGIVYALCSSNYAFDQSSPNHLRSIEISEAFGTNPRSTAQKSNQIRDKYGIGYEGDTEFETKWMRDQEAEQEEAVRKLAPRILAYLPDEPDKEPAPPSRQGGEFVDSDHPVMTRHYALLEKYDNARAHPIVQSGMEDLIRRDPDFYDPYLVLADLHRAKGREQEAAELLGTAYQRALARVLDSEGQWPQTLEWGWLENRHIIRTFLNQAIALWNARDSDGALDIFRHLLRANPGDNAGVRYYLLAILLGLTFAQYEKKFLTPLGYDGSKVLDWFDSHIGQFPDDFDGWKDAVGYDRE